MTPSPFTFSRREDAQSLELTFARKVNNFTAPDLDVFIAMLGELRSRMQPPVAADAATVSEAHIAAQCDFRKLLVDGQLRSPTEAGAVFLFQSQRFGWFQFPANAQFCSDLLQWLQSADAPA